MIGCFETPSPAGKRNFRLAEALSISGATDVPGADDSGGTLIGLAPRGVLPRGDQVRAAGASDARVTDDSDRLRTLENGVSIARARRLESRERPSCADALIRATEMRSRGQLDWQRRGRVQSSFRDVSGWTAGPSSTAPSTSNREPWHGQSQLRSAPLKRSRQPRWVQRSDTPWSLPVSSR